MIDANRVIQPKDVEHALAVALRQEVVCVFEDDELRVDTPYVLQNGAMLRAYMRWDERGQDLVVSDGSYAAEQMELYAASASALRDRYAEMRRIARRLMLDWDTAFSFRAATLDEAAARTPLLAQAVDQSLSLLTPRQRRAAPALHRELAAELMRAGLNVVHRAKIRAGNDVEVTVDYRLQRGRREAAVEVLGGLTKPSALIAVDRTAADFRELEEAHYSGLLVAVVDEGSPAALPRLRQRFDAARPSSSIVLPAGKAVPLILERLAA